MRVVLLSVVCAFTAAAALAEENHDYKLTFITKAKSQIVIDGKMDEAAWAAAKPITDFGPAGWSYRMTAFMPLTEARLVWDEKYLYIAMRCYEDTPENMAKLRLQAADRSGDIFQRDIVEFHVNGPNPGELPKLQVGLTPSCIKNIIRYYDNGWGAESDSDYARVADYALASSLGENYWIIEARISHESLGSVGRVGFRLGFNIGRLRFGKNFVDAVTKQPTSVNYVLDHSWADRERGGQHSTRGGRGIFVENEPANVVEGLRLSYPDLDSRTVLVQTDSKYVVVKNGKISELGYVEKARELLEAAKVKSTALFAISNGIPEPKKGFFSRCFANVENNLKQIDEKLAEVRTMKSCGVGVLTTVTEQCQKWSKAAEDARWSTIRELLFTEAKVRFPVELKVDPTAPKVEDQYSFLQPTPWSRKITAPTWLKPLAKGKKKIFVGVAFGDAFAAWDIMHRLDVEADVVTLEDFIHARDLINLEKDYRIKRSVGKAKLIENLFAQNQYDGFLFMGVRVSALPLKVQCAMAERVIAGAKLVAINEWGVWLPVKDTDDSLVAGAPKMMRLERVKGTEYGTEEVPCVFPPFTRRTLGAGEYLRWQPGRSGGFREHSAFMPGWCFAPSAIFNDEYAYAAGVRFIGEGLGALGPARLASVTAADVEPNAKIAVTATATAVAPNAQLVVALRGADGKVVSKPQTLALTAAGHYDLVFDGLTTGRYFVDATAKIGDKICDAVAGSFAVKPSHGEQCRCTPNCRGFKPAPKVIAIRPTRRPFRPQEPIVAKVIVTNAVEGLVLHGELKDPMQRVMEKGTFAVVASNGVAEVKFPCERLTENCHFIALKLVDRNGLVIDLAEQDIYRKLGKRDDFSVFTSGFFPGGIVGERRQAQLDYYGMTLTQDGSQTRLMYGGDAAIRNRIAGNSTGDGCSMSSPYYHDKLWKSFNLTARKISPYNGVCISCGDDSRVPEVFGGSAPDWVAPFFDRLAEYLRAMAKAQKLAEWQITRRWCVEHGFKMMTGDTASLRHHIGSLGALHYLLDHPLYPHEIPFFVDACKTAYRGKDAIERFNLQNGVKITDWKDIDAKLIMSIKPTPSSEFVNFIFWLREKYKGDLKPMNAFWQADVKDFAALTQETVADLSKQGKYGAELDRREFFRDLAVKQFKTIRNAVNAADPDIAVFMGCSAYNNSAEDAIPVLGSCCPYWARYTEDEFLRTQLKPKAMRGRTLGTYGSPRETKESREFDVYGLMLAGCNFSWFWDTFIGFRGDLGLDPGMCGYTCDALRELNRGHAALLLRARRDNGGVRILRSVRSGALDGLVTNGRTPMQAFKVAAGAVENNRCQWDMITSSEVERGTLGSAKLLLMPSALLLSEKEAQQIRAFVERGGVAIADSRPAFLALNGSELKAGMLDDVFGIVNGKLPTAGTLVPFGKGATAILDFQNADLSQYLAKAGVKPICAFDAGGKPVEYAEIAKYVRGGIDAIVYRKRPSGLEKYPLAAAMKFAKPAWTYDVRQGKEIGFVDTIPLTLGGFDTGLFARLPYQVKGLQVNAPKSIAQGANFEIEASVVAAPGKDGKAVKPETHLLRVELLPPGGLTPERRAPIRFRLVDAPKGQAKVSIAIAHNEPVGAVYTLEVTDIATGAKFTQPVTIR